LKKPVARVDLGTGVFTPIDKMTNEEALIKYISTQVYVYIIVISMASYFILLIFFCLTV